MKRQLKQSNLYLFQLVSFIGMCSYYRRLIPNFCQIAEPVIALTRKCAHFKCSDTHQKGFEYLKDSLIAVPLLVHLIQLSLMFSIQILVTHV